jgi:hypothetical protein
MGTISNVTGIDPLPNGGKGRPPGSGMNGLVPNGGKGRPPGTKNKFSASIKDQMLKALDKLGGVDYLVRLGNEQPAVFGSLLGRVIPMEITGRDGGPLVVSWDMSGFSTPNAPAIASPNAPMIEGRVEDAVEVADARVRGHADGEVEVGEAE